MDSHSGMRLSETARDIGKHRQSLYLLTE